MKQKFKIETQKYKQKLNIKEEKIESVSMKSSRLACRGHSPVT